MKTFGLPSKSPDSRIRPEIFYYKHNAHFSLNTNGSIHFTPLIIQDCDLEIATHQARLTYVINLNQTGSNESRF